jgi:hypothetical protein
MACSALRKTALSARCLHAAHAERPAAEVPLLTTEPCGDYPVAPAVLLSARFEFIRDQIGTFGGQPDAASNARSLYPFAFSQRDEEGILARLIAAQFPESESDALN